MTGGLRVWGEDSSPLGPSGAPPLPWITHGAEPRDWTAKCQGARRRQLAKPLGPHRGRTLRAKQMTGCVRVWGEDSSPLGPSGAPPLPWITHGAEPRDWTAK